MTAVRYPRQALMVLKVEGSSPESVLRFLRLNSPKKHYIILSEPTPERETLLVQNTLDQGTVIGLLPSTVIVRDMEQDDVEFIYSQERLKELGIDGATLASLIEARAAEEGLNLG